MSRWNKDVKVGDRCVLTLPLHCTQTQLKQLDKTFKQSNDIKNLLIGWYSTQKIEMTRTRAWHENQRALRELHVEYDADVKAFQVMQDEVKEGRKLSMAEQKKYKRLQARAKEFEEKQQPFLEIRNAMLEKYGFSRNEFEKRIAKYRGPYSAYIGSMVAQRIADDVWASFESCLFSKGKKTLFSKNEKLSSIEGKNNTANIVFDRKSMTVAIGQGRHKIRIKVKRSHTDSYGYEEEALSRRVCYCRIIRKANPENWQYFIQLVLEGRPPVKVNPDTGEVVHPMGKGRVGLDIGPQTLAFSADKTAGLVELAPGAQNLEKQLRRVNRAMDRSRKAMNPDMFYENGQVVPKNKLPKKCRTRYGGRKWVKSKRYRRLERYRRYLYRKQADLRREKHRQLANQLLAAGDNFFVEDMRWRALAKRSKKPRKNKKGKNLSKKRYGKSIANKAPGTLLSILEQKVVSQGGQFRRITTWKAKASQFDHTTGKYNKKTLSQRFHKMDDGTKIQRDLYSAFLQQHTNDDLESFDVDLCKKDFPGFIAMHDKVMADLEASPDKLPSSMGIRRKKAA